MLPKGAYPRNAGMSVQSTCLSMKTMELMVFMVFKKTEKTWLRLQGKNKLPKLITSVKFKDGIEH
jgi:putative transposase